MDPFLNPSGEVPFDQDPDFKSTLTSCGFGIESTCAPEPQALQMADAITRAYYPFRELDRIRGEVNRIFGDTLARLPAMEWHETGYPPIDVYATSPDHSHQGQLNISPRLLPRVAKGRKALFFAGNRPPSGAMRKLAKNPDLPPDTTSENTSALRQEAVKSG